MQNLKKIIKLFNFLLAHIHILFKPSLPWFLLFLRLNRLASNFPNRQLKFKRKICGSRLRNVSYAKCGF